MHILRLKLCHSSTQNRIWKEIWCIWSIVGKINPFRQNVHLSRIVFHILQYIYKWLSECLAVTRIRFFTHYVVFHVVTSSQPHHGVSSFLQRLRRCGFIEWGVWLQEQHARSQPSPHRVQYCLATADSSSQQMSETSRLLWWEPNIMQFAPYFEFILYNLPRRT